MSEPSLLREKFDWVKGAMTELQLTLQEQNWLLGGDGFTCAIDHIDPESDGGKKFEARLDSIAEILMDLERIFGDKPDAHAQWLRQPRDIIPLNGQSPLHFIRDGEDDAAQQLVWAIHGP